MFTDISKNKNPPRLALVNFFRLIGFSMVKSKHSSNGISRLAKIAFQLIEIKRLINPSVLNYFALDAN